MVTGTVLFEPFQLRGVTLRNRIGVSPMCEYSSVDGFAGDWHLVHLGSRAVGGAGLVFTEAAAVTAEGRISPSDLGIYDDAHVAMLSRITAFVAAQGAVPGIQLAHAGRKASTKRPWDGNGNVPPSSGGWTDVLAPSPIAFEPDMLVPHEIDEARIAQVIDTFARAAKRAERAGFQVVELHGAHGYLMHEFLSPLSNRRTDRYGGSFDNRVRFVREVVEAVRRVWPERYPLVLRISASDWAPGGWTIDDSVELARVVAPLGVDLIDASSGGAIPDARIITGPGYQVPFAERIRRESGVPTAAVGMITDPQQAEAIVADGQADIVLLARELLRDPYWPLRAAHALGLEPAYPAQYERAKPRRARVPA